MLQFAQTVARPCHHLLPGIPENAIAFKSVVVHEDFENLRRNDRTRITNAADKQFTTLDDFREKAEEFLAREAA